MGVDKQVSRGNLRFPPTTPFPYWVFSYKKYCKARKGVVGGNVVSPTT